MLTLSVIKNRFILETSCTTIVNFVSCDGILLENNITSELYEKFQTMKDKYINLCNRKLLDIGKLWLYYDKNDNDKQQNISILNFPIKRTYNESKTDYNHIEIGMQKFIDTYKEKDISTIAFPISQYFNQQDKDKVVENITKYLIKCDNLIAEIYY